MSLEACICVGPKIVGVIVWSTTERVVDFYLEPLPMLGVLNCTCIWDM